MTHSDPLRYKSGTTGFNPYMLPTSEETLVRFEFGGGFFVFFKHGVYYHRVTRLGSPCGGLRSKHEAKFKLARIYVPVICLE